MVRTKIEINIASLNARSKSIHIIVGSKTTTADVLRKVLEKCHISTSPSSYQLWTVTKGGKQERCLQEGDCLSHVIPSHGSAFAVRVRPSESGLVRIYHTLQGDYQTFQSLIVTTDTTGRDVVQLAVTRMVLREGPEAFQLVQKTGRGEVLVGDDVHILRLVHIGSSNHFELKWKPRSKSSETTLLHTASPLPPSLSHNTASPLTPSHPLIPPHPHPLTQPATGQDLPDGLSHIELMKGKLRLHSELIEALQGFAMKSAGSDTSSVVSREGILEQALVEQNEILDVMQELIDTLESESKYDKQKISAQSKVIQDLSGCESRALEAEKQLRELKSSTTVSPTSGNIPYSAISGFEKTLAQKDQTIASLQSKLDSTPVDYRLGEADHPPSAPWLNSTRAKLEAERVRVIELEEELSTKKLELEKLKSKVSEKQSTLLSKESEVLHFRYELESQKKFGTQQQELVMRQRTALQDKDLQLTSLTRAFNKEKKMADQLRRTQLFHSGSLSPPFVAKVGDSASRHNTQLFDQVMGREVHTVELSRLSGESDLGLRISRVDLPVSSKLSCVVVKAVKEGSVAFGAVRPGDEVLEVNGYMCRSPDQAKAMECLERKVGVIKLVLARDSDQEDSLEALHLHSSTPVKSLDRSELWATALTSPVVDEGSQAFRSRVSSVRYSEANAAEFVSILNDSKSLSESPLVEGERQPPLPSLNEPPTNGHERAESEADHSQLLKESEQLILQLQEELDGARSELDHVQMELELTTAENHDLQQQVASHEEEVAEIQQHVSELQSTLLSLETQLTDDQQKITSLENLNKVHLSESLEAREIAEAAQKEKATLSQEVARLKGELVEQNENERKRIEEHQSVCSERDQLTSDVAERDNQIDELRGILERERKGHEDVICEVKQQNKALQLEVDSMKDASVKSASSSHEDLQHLQTQLSSAKALLLESERKEAELKMEKKHLKQAADLANQQLGEIEDEYKRLRGEVGTYKHMVEEKTVEIESLRLGLKATQGQLSTKQEILARLQGDTHTLRRTNARLQGERSQTEDAKSKLQSRLKVAESELVRLEEKMKDSTSEKDALFQQLEESVAEATQLQSELDEVKSKLCESESVAVESKAQLESQVRTLSELSRKDGASKDLEKEHVQQMEGLKALNESLATEVDSLKTAKKARERELEASQKRCDTLAQQCSKYKEETKQLQSISESLRKDVQETRAEIERLDSSRHKLTQQLADAADKCKQLSCEVDQKDESLHDARATMGRLEEDLTREKAHNEELDASITTLTSQAAQFKREKKRGEDMVASFEFMREQTQAKMEQLEDTLKKREADVGRLNRELTETTGQLQKNKSENVHLDVNLSDLRRQLEEIERERGVESSTSKERVASLQQEVGQLKGEVKAHKSEATKQQSAFNELKSSLDHSNKERFSLQKELDNTVQEKAGSEAHIKQLEGQVARLKSELTQMEDSSNSLSSESATLRQQLKQSRRQVDDLSAQLQAKEMNLNVAIRSLSESERFVAESRSRAESLELQLEEAQSKWKDSQEELEKMALEVHAKDEQLSKLKAGIDLHQHKCSQLEYSLIEAQGSVSSARSQVGSLESEKRDLQATVDQLEQAQQELKHSLLSLEREKLSKVGKWKSEVEHLRIEVQEHSEREERHSEEMQRLRRSEEEARSTVDQLVAAQEALKQSLSSLGDEKEVEIMRLGGRVLELEGSLTSTKDDLSKSRSREEELEARLKETEEHRSTLEEQREGLEREKEELSQEVELLRATESQLCDLHSKVSELQEGLRSKNERLGELERTSQQLELELNTTKTENEALLSEVAELASLKVSLVESTAEADKLRGDLKMEAKAHKETSAERDQLLTMLRKLEVEKHTQVVQQPSPKLQKGEPSKNKEQLLKLLKDKEEEAYRLKEYVGKLLSTVVERAPFVLENMT